MRPLHVVRSDDDIESTLVRMQSEAATVCVVEEAGAPVGLVTLEDILEQVIGRIEDEYPHERTVSLREAVSAGGVILELAGRTPEQVIEELAAAIPSERIPQGANIASLANARENDISTDLGIGVAIPHARCANLQNALIVFGRSSEGVLFSPQAPELVQFVFLLVTPLEQPDLQLSLLAQLSRVVASNEARDRLRQATSVPEVFDVISDDHQSH